MTIQDLKDNNLIILECISGSKAYGLDLPTSDTDIRGVFVLPQAQFYGLDYVQQVSDKKNDVVYYELSRFVELLYKNNPNILELLNTAPEDILQKDPLINWLTPKLFLSKRCKDSFSGYAMSQIHKAKGLNKKIHNPMPKERKTVMDFCYVIYKQGSIPLKRWLEKESVDQAHCGLVNVPNMRSIYGIYYDPSGELGYQGMMRQRTQNTLVMSSIPKGEIPIGFMSYNEDGYRKYCKDYKEYWDWVEKRNEARYENTLAHGKNYDAKNLMHTFRLLDMAAEILAKQQVIVKRPNREELLAIRAGKYNYDTLIEKAEAKMEKINTLYQTTTLPDQPDKAKINAVLVKIRKSWYAKR